MTIRRVLIVEDDALIALDVQQALLDAGYDVCGSASSELQALSMAEQLRPEMAVVDISLGPGDGRVVARALCSAYDTRVLFATGQCDEIEGMRSTGALGCLPKPYAASMVPRALQAINRHADGDRSEPLPDHMFSLAAA